MTQLAYDNITVMANNNIRGRVIAYAHVHVRVRTHTITKLWQNNMIDYVLFQLLVICHSCSLT